MEGGANGVVGVDQGNDGVFSLEGTGDGGGDLFAGRVRQLLVYQLGGIGAALADETGVEPLPRDPFELSEQVKFGFRVGVTPLGVEKASGQVKEECGMPHIPQVFKIEVHAFPDNPLVSCFRRADEFRGQCQDGVLVECRGQAFFGQFNAISRNPGKLDFKVIPLGPDGVNLNSGVICPPLGTVTTAGY